MSIKPYQSSLISVGHFDVLDTDLSEIKGGEVLVFDRITASLLDEAAPDVYVDDNGDRTALRLATPLDVGPFYLANVEDRQSRATPGFELTTLFGQQASFGQVLDASSKVSIFSGEGFYAISSDVVDNSTVNESTVIHSRLYVNSEGKLTAQPSGAGAIVGFFLDYRLGDILRASKIRPAEVFAQGDSVIMYKTNADGYLNLNFLSTLIGQEGTLGLPSDGIYSDGYVALSQNTTVADAIDGINEIVFDLTLNHIGVPTDGTYADGYVPFEFYDTVADAVDALNEVTFELSKKEIGIPTDGTFTDGYVHFNYNTTVANAVDSLNEVVSGLAAKKIGIPSDLTYADGYFGFDYNTTTADAVDALNEKVKEINDRIFTDEQDGYIYTGHAGYTAFSPIELTSYSRGLALGITRVNDEYNVSLNDYTVLVEALSGMTTIRLPVPSIHPGQIYVIKKIDATLNPVRVVVSNGFNIDGAIQYMLLNPYDAAAFQTDGAEWFSI